MRKFYFLFKIDLKKELTLYSYNSIFRLGIIIDNNIDRTFIGHYTGKAMCVDNLDNGIDYYKMGNDIKTISKNYKLNELEEKGNDKVLGGYIIHEYPEIETSDISNLDLKISKFYEIKESNGINNLHETRIDYTGYYEGIHRDIKLGILGI